MRRFGRFILYSLALIGLTVLLLTGGGIWAAIAWRDKTEPDLPKRMILTLDLEAPFHETAHNDPFAAFSGKKSYSLRKIVDALDRAARDERVQAVFATMGGSSLDMAQIQEIRDAVADFRKSGKPAVLFAETMGEFGAGTRDYYLASSFGRIWLQPSGDVGLTGYSIESPFLRGALDLLGIQPQFSGRKDYKSAVETFTRTDYSPAHRETVNGLLDAWTAQTVAGIARDRRMGEDKVRALFGAGPYGAAEALSAGLVDKLGYYDEAWADAGGEDKRNRKVDLAAYAARAAAVDNDSAGIAVITGSGAISRGESGGPLNDDQKFAAGEIAKALRDAADSPKIKAIILRVNSPGGSYVASDTVRREVARAREAGKPVVASMSGAAASGGYFVSMDADRIVAQPGTITGSIGVFSGKMVLQDFWSKIGISWDGAKRGENSDMFSANKPFSPVAWDRMNSMLDRIYADFTAKAAKGRNMAPERMEELAQGRVWSGADAHARGLVDSLGGWKQAQMEIRTLLKLEPDAPLKLLEYPKPKKPWEMFAQMLDDGAADMRAVAALAGTARILAPVLERMPPQAGADVLRMPQDFR